MKKFFALFHQWFETVVPLEEVDESVAVSVDRSERLGPVGSSTGHLAGEFPSAVDPYCVDADCSYRVGSVLVICVSGDKDLDNVFAIGLDGSIVGQCLTVVAPDEAGRGQAAVVQDGTAGPRTGTDFRDEDLFSRSAGD